MNDISIIIPFYNELENVSFLVSEIENFVKKNEKLKFEIVLIDDGSGDNSVESFLAHLTDFICDVKIVKLSKNFGSHAAVRSGLLVATSKYNVFISADLQDPLNLVIDLWEKALEGYDVVFASRNNLPSGNFEKYFSKFYSVLMKKFVNVLYPKNGFDTVIFNYKIRDALNQNIESNSSIQLQILNLGFKRAFIEYTKQIRKSGKSKWTISKKVKLFIDSFVAFSYAPIRFVTIIGITLFVIGITFSIYLFGRKILYNDLVSGWPMLISILTFGFGITNISLGIIAEYLWRTYDSSRKRPVFIIDDIIDLKNKKNGK